MARVRDRRRRRRVPLDVEVCEANERGMSRVRARDISELGVRYGQSGLGPRPDGDEVLLYFRLPGDPDPIQVEGLIADDRCMGAWSETRVTFAWPKAGDARRIREFVDAQAAWAKDRRKSSSG